MASVDRALQLLKNYPRVTLSNVKSLPRSRPSKYNGLKRKKRGLGHRGFSQFQAWRPIGSLERKTPFYIKTPYEPYNEGYYFKRELPRISLLEVQRLIDLGRLDRSEPIDLTSICNTKLYSLDVFQNRHYGFHLTEEGIDQFVAKVNIEVQFASEAVIAAVERNGGTILTRFYDLLSVQAKNDPLKFFMEGMPIPKCRLPPVNAVEYYTSAENRGYLADPNEIGRSRLVLAQKYGYDLVDLDSDPEKEMLLRRKDPRQIFLDLEPGWLVDLVNETVLKPTDPEVEAFYQS